jgi:hypothetical protein
MQNIFIPVHDPFSRKNCCWYKNGYQPLQSCYTFNKYFYILLRFPELLEIYACNCSYRKLCTKNLDPESGRPLNNKPAYLLVYYSNAENEKSFVNISCFYHPDYIFESGCCIPLLRRSTCRIKACLRERYGRLRNELYRYRTR